MRLRQISGEANVALKVSPRWLLPVLSESTRRTETVEFCAAEGRARLANKYSPSERHVRNLLIVILHL